jgi:hypothetical protein
MTKKAPRTVTLKDLAEAINATPEQVKTVLDTVWSIDLLAAASGYAPRYVRWRVSNKRINGGLKVGRDWIVSREGGDAWLKEIGVDLELGL